MNKRIFLSVGLIILVAFLCLGFYLLGNIRTAQSISVKTVNPAQLADAMKGDYFYSDYRKNALIVSGQVSSVSLLNNSRQISFKTPTDYTVFCQLSADTPTPAKGSLLTLVSVGGSALRQPNGVELVGCTKP